MKLIAHDQETPVTVSEQQVRKRIRRLSDPGDFLVLRSNSGEVRVADPVKELFLMQCSLSQEMDSLKGERDNVPRDDVEEIFVSFYNGNTDWASGFRRRSKSKILPILLLLFVLVVIVAYVVA